MASSSSSHQQNEGQHAFSGIENPRVRRKASESSRVFDVFINHRGPDVKETLARQLYNSLKDLEIWVFLDSEEIQYGHSFPSSIENAINSASVHIAIFSKGYAESPWCLEELVLMIQSTATIIPVFYEVKPSALRYVEKGQYASAFTEYEEKKRYPEKLKKWKKALQTVSYIRGFEINNLNVGNIQMIVSAVQDEVKRRKSLYVAQHPVGLHKLVKDFESLCLHKHVQDIQRQSGMDEGDKGKVQIVGIFGMGGVGKTTLAKELFNRKRSQYTRACFLFDVREAYSKNSFPSLQMKLVKDLFQVDGLNFHCTEEGTSYIGDCIGRSKKKLSFLIVLDDINHVQQLDALLIMDMLKKSADSLIIVTTRDVGVLIKTGIFTRYNLKGMDREDARELFCWHAFDQPHPANDYQILVESFLNVCGGLPVSLQVIGRHVHGRDHSYWSSELNKVKKALPRDIHQRLKISFDALDYQEKQIFMDIACFFNDKSKSIAMSVWEGSGWSAQSALEALKNKCLVEEVERVWALEGGKWNHVPGLRMHDHLRDLGREIANDLYHPRRLWRRQDLKNLESKGFINILAQTKGRCFHSFYDDSMTSQITYFLGESDFSADTAISLLWLQLDCQGVWNYPSIPSWIPLQNLQCLIIRDLRLKTLWQNHVERSIPSCIPLQNLGCSIISKLRLNKLRQSHVQAPTQLKELQIYDTSLVKFSDLAGISNSLEKLIIDNCTHLKTLPGLSDLKKLTELNISMCSNLQELSVVHLSCLKNILIGNCSNLKTVSGLSDLKKLTDLNISKCSNLRELSVMHLSCLEKMIIHNCYSLKTVSGLSNLKKLTGLNISKCPHLQRLSAVHLSSLEEMNLHHCYGLKTVSVSDLGKLVELNISRCPVSEQVRLAGLNSLKRIKVDQFFEPKYFELDECRNLEIIQRNLNLEKLVCFKIRDCPKLEAWPSLEGLSNLETVTIDGCGNLKSLFLSECPNLQRVKGKLGLDCLERITIYGCGKLNCLQVFKCQNLKEVYLSDCSELEELPCFTRQTCLEKISILRCGKLQNITLPTKLVELEIEDCRELKAVTAICDHSECLELQELSSVARLSCLKWLTIYSCDKLQTIEGINKMHALESLRLSDCPELEELPWSSRQSCLLKIKIVRAGKLRTLQGIDELHALQSLKLSDCTELEELPWSAGQTCLMKIKIVGAGKLRTLQGIDELDGLRSLQLFNCPELEMLPCSASQTCLEKIIIIRCKKLQSITLPTNLVELRIKSCRELKTVAAICHPCECLELQESSSVAQLSCLKRITIQTCDKLQMIQGIDELHALERMHLSYCSNVATRDCISMLKSVPSEFLFAVGRAVDGARSTLNRHLFSGVDILFSEGVALGDSTEIWSAMSAVIFCAVVYGSTAVEVNDLEHFWKGNLDSDKESVDSNFKLWRQRYIVPKGVWIITIAADPDKMSYNGKSLIEHLVYSRALMAGCKLGVKKGEEWKTQHVLHTIIDRLYLPEISSS